MKNDHNLTKADIKKLSELGIRETEILLKSRVDLTFDGEYAEGFIVVTKDKVSVVTGKLPEGCQGVQLPSENHRPYDAGGTERADRAAPPEDAGWI